MEENLYAPMIFQALAVPICRSDGYVEPMIFDSNMPKMATTDARRAFYDELGNLVPHPKEGVCALPAFCKVQYSEEYPPPPPEGYVYVKSELEKDPLSPAYQFYHNLGTPRYGLDTPNYIGLTQVKLTKEERSGMYSDLEEHPEGYYSRTHGLISNFLINPRKLYHIHYGNDIVRDSIEYSVTTRNLCLLSIGEYEVDKLDRLPEYIRKSIAGCATNIRYPDADAKITFHIRSQLLRLARVDKYIFSGWVRLSKHWLYAQDSIRSSDSVVFSTGYTIARNNSIEKQNAMHNALGMLLVCEKKSVIVPMFLFAHLGCLFTVFEQAGHPPRMVLFINGKTGSLKTAMCAVLFNLTGDCKRNIPASFRDTVASIEAKFADYTDKVLLLDDFSPATTSKSKQDMTKLLEDIIRYYGDGKGRGRSNAKVTESTTPIPRGLCCITGEDTGGSQSSILRCVVINVANGTFNGEKLAKYQETPTLWTTHFAWFVEYLAENFNSIVEQIRTEFPLLRNELKTFFRANRIIDSAVFLILTARIVLDYAVSIMVFSSAEALHQFALWKTAIIDAVSESESASNEHDPVKFYLTTIFDAVDSGVEEIAPNKTVFISKPSLFGYQENNQWHIWPDRAYDLVNRRSKLLHFLFPLSISKIHAALADAKIIQTSTEQRGSKTCRIHVHRESFGKRPRMLIVDIASAQAYLNQK